MSEGKYIGFFLVGSSESGKTSIWEVRAKEDYTLLGHVKWHFPWRQYSFFPYVPFGELDQLAKTCSTVPNLTCSRLKDELARLKREGLVFEKVCLRDIATFCEQQTQTKVRRLKNGQTK